MSPQSVGRAIALASARQWPGPASRRRPRTGRLRCASRSSPRLRFAKLLVGEVPEGRPVFARHRMLAGPDEVAELTVDEFTQRWNLFRIESTGVEESVHGVGRLQDLELAVRVR